jgi:hypothetical protein
LLRKVRKEVIRGEKTDLQDSRIERTISRREEQHFFDSRIEIKAEKETHFWFKEAMGRVWIQDDK